jgi:hypothetical protein
MRRKLWVVVFALILAWPTRAHAENLVKEVKKAVERSTLDQTGTRPFHLKASLAPSRDRDKDYGLTGEVEIWWASPTKWKREMRSAEFHCVEIVDGERDWQKSEGDYYPEWLRETTIALVKPVPPLDQVLEQVKTAEVRRLMGMTNIDWITATGTADVRNISTSNVALRDSTGLLLYASGFGWGGEFKDYADFHGRMIARTVNVGTPQVTARVTTLEDLGDPSAGLFDADAKNADVQPLRTLLIDEPTLRKNLLPMQPPSWPPLKDGPLEGNVTTEVVIDREGKVREIKSVVSENSGVNEAGRRAFVAMRFRPFLLDGMPVQVMSQVTLPFKTLRPAGAEIFESARAYFERGRRVGFAAGGSGAPYVLRAEFQAKVKAGTVEKGHYTDTWIAAEQWRREASIGDSSYVRAQHGEKRYELAEGPDAGFLKFVLKLMEPIPAIDRFQEADWKIKRDPVNSASTVRVLTGYESPEGKLDAAQVRGYWFDDSGLLVKTYFSGIETQRSEFEDFAGAKIARQIDVLKDEVLAMRIHITDVTPAGSISPTTFELPKHEWVRAFTDEVR